MVHDRARKTHLPLRTNIFPTCWGRIGRRSPWVLGGCTNWDLSNPPVAKWKLWTARSSKRRYASATHCSTRVGESSMTRQSEDDCDALSRDVRLEFFRFALELSKIRGTVVISNWRRKTTISTLHIGMFIKHIFKRVWMESMPPLIRSTSRICESQERAVSPRIAGESLGS
jgi:hypothetical protein